VVELAAKMGARTPEATVVGLEPNFYVTEANVICLDGKLKGRSMFLCYLCVAFLVSMK
jgi:hypothetical protein